MTTVEVVRFRISSDRVGNLLDARARMLQDFRSDRAGLVDAKLIQLENGDWLDILLWRTPDDFATSRAKGANLPGIQAFFEAIGEVVSTEDGRVMDEPRASP
jgi:hypothetical protein